MPELDLVSVVGGNDPRQGQGGQRRDRAGERGHGFSDRTRRGPADVHHADSEPDGAGTERHRHAGLVAYHGAIGIKGRKTPGEVVTPLQHDEGVRAGRFGDRAVFDDHDPRTEPSGSVDIAEPGERGNDEHVVVAQGDGCPTVKGVDQERADALGDLLLIECRGERFRQLQQSFCLPPRHDVERHIGHRRADADHLGAAIA